MPYDATDFTPSTVAEPIARTRLRQLADHIGGLPPERFDMHEWCGTAVCMGGHSAALFGGEPHRQGDALGLTPSQEAALFLPSTSCCLQAWFDRGRTPFTATNSEAARVLDHLLETGEVNWAVAFQDDAK